MASIETENIPFRKRIAPCVVAAALTLGTAVPAFASEDDGEAPAENSPSISETVALDVAPATSESSPSSESETNEIPVVNDTLPLTPAGQPIAAESMSDSKKKEQEREDSAEEAEEDTETCVWTKDGSTWSTSRGGSLMSVTDALAFGIDISEWQGDIDWAAAKADGVQFAIIRCAYGSAASGHADKWFFENVQGCKDNGIPFGVYLYSIATTPDESALEAQHALDLLNEAAVTPEDLVYPVYLDLEDSIQKDLDATFKGDLAETFCDMISAAGFTPGIYANAYWFNNLLTDERFDNWTKWAASYPSAGKEDASSSYTGSHQMWQCMSRGVIDGISTRVDINFDYNFGEGHYAPVYDFDYYIENNPDIAEYYADDPTGAFNHFVTVGMAEGRPSSPEFNLHGYFNSNADLRHDFGLDLKQYYLHYLNSGMDAGRSMTDWTIPKGIAHSINVIDFSSIYDPFVYLSNNPDLSENFVREINGQDYLDDFGLFRHFISQGMGEGRIAK